MSNSEDPVLYLKGTSLCIFRDELVGTTMNLTIHRSTPGHAIIVRCLIVVSDHTGMYTAFSGRLNVSNNLKLINQNSEELTN